jgi:hypothetical protein
MAAMPRRAREKVTAATLTREKLSSAVLHLLQLAVEYESALTEPHAYNSELANAAEIYRETWPMMGTQGKLAQVVDLLEQHRSERVIWRKDSLAALLLSWTCRFLQRFDPGELKADRRMRVARVLQLKFLTYSVDLSDSDAERLIQSVQIMGESGADGTRRRVRTALAGIFGGHGEDYLGDIQTAIVEGEVPEGRVRTREQAFALIEAEANRPDLKSEILAYVLRLIVAGIREDLGDKMADGLVKMLVYIWDCEYADLYGVESKGDWMGAILEHFKSTPRRPSR